jgi:hypothetical protein
VLGQKVAVALELAVAVERAVDEAPPLAEEVVDEGVQLC